MQYSPLVYSRTFSRNADYRIIATPSPDFCPISIRDEFVKFIKDVINVDNPLYEFLETQRWSAFKHGDFLLVGVGIMNHSIYGLDSIFSSDAYGRPIRSFIGIVINKVDETEKNILTKLWGSGQFIAQIFKDYVLPRWEEEPGQTLEIPSKLLAQLLPENAFKNSYYSIVNDLNKIKDKVKIYPSNQDVSDYTDSNSLFYSLIGSAVNYINLVTNLNNDKHAVECCFMNATTKEAKGKKLVSIQRPIPTNSIKTKAMGLDEKPNPERPIAPKEKSSDWFGWFFGSSRSPEDDIEEKKEIPQSRELNKQNKPPSLWLNGMEPITKKPFESSDKDIVVDAQREVELGKFSEKIELVNALELPHKDLKLSIQNQEEISSDLPKGHTLYINEKNTKLHLIETINKLRLILTGGYKDITLQEISNKLGGVVSKYENAESNEIDNFIEEINNELKDWVNTFNDK